MVSLPAAGAVAIVNRERLNGCRKKVRHVMKRHAQEAVEHALRFHGLRMRIYHCRWCKGYHLTSKVQARELV